MAGSLNITLLQTNLLTQLILIGLKCDYDNDDDDDDDGGEPSRNLKIFLFNKWVSLRKSRNGALGLRNFSF